MEINKYAIGAVVGVVVTAATVYCLARSKPEPVKPQPKKETQPEPDLDLFKESMVGRYEIPEAVKVSADARKELIKGIHANIKVDIMKLYEKKYHKELNAYNEELFKQHQ